MIHPDDTHLHEPTSEEEKRHREAALDETLEGTMDASDAPSTIPDPAVNRDEADVRRQALRQRSEGVRAHRRSVNGEDGGFGAMPIDDVER